MSREITSTTIVTPSKDLLACDLDKDVVLLNFKTGMYYGFDGVGARIWSLVQEPRSVAEIRDTLVKEYDVEPARCEQDIVQLLGRAPRGWADRVGDGGFVNKLSQFFQLPPRQRSLALGAMVVVGLVRVALWVVPFRWLSKAVARLSRIPPRRLSAASLPAERITWIIAGVSQMVPRATCLTQALAAQIFLAAAGHPSVLIIGVRKGGKGGLESHALIESAGQVVLGGPAAGFTPIVVISSQSRGGRASAVVGVWPMN